jgi:hypothetical protein
LSFIKCWDSENSVSQACQPFTAVSINPLPNGPRADAYGFILAVEMEAAALYAFARARNRAVLCFAHVTNKMGRIEGDFGKGAADGAEESLRVISLAAGRWREESDALRA